MDELAKVWLACAIDSEGCISIRRSYDVGLKHKFHYNLLVAITNTKIDYIKYAKSICGMGKICISTGGKILLYFNQSDSVIFLNAILPYLVIKRKQAILALELRELLNMSTSQNNIFYQQAAMRNKMLKLNASRLGVRSKGSKYDLKVDK